MKICHVINSLNRGGAESHLLELAKAQNNEGLLIDIVVIGKDNKNIFSIEQELITCCNNIFRLNGPRMFNLFSYFKLKNLIKNNEYDIIHSHQPRSDYMIHILKKYFFSKTLFKWIVSIHGKYDSYLENNYKKVFKLYFFKKLLKSWTFADSVIVISHEVESWLKNLTEKIQPYVINYWISIKEHRNINQNQNLTIGFLGRLNKNKGIEDLIKSLNNLPIQFNFVIGGHGSNSYIGYLKDQMTSELQEKTTFLGYIEDQSKFFEGIDIFVFPSKLIIIKLTSVSLFIVSIVSITELKFSTSISKLPKDFLNVIILKFLKIESLDKLKVIKFSFVTDLPRKEEIISVFLKICKIKGTIIVSRNK